MRLDKYISSITIFSRAETKKIIKKGVLVNNVLVKQSDYQINEVSDEVIINGEKLVYQKYVYIMMNKPGNIISATEDKKETTVVDILDEKDRLFNPFPVGRLDKDTEGLMLLTNDGDLAHKLISPKKDVIKKYYVEVDGKLKDEHMESIKDGIVLEDGYKTKCATLEILDVSDYKSSAYISITEGKFHQVKRMMKALGVNVTYLKRLSIGTLVLDEKLKLGEYRYLTDTELKNLKK